MRVCSCAICVNRFHYPQVLIVINAGVMTFLCKCVVVYTEF